MSLRCGWCIDGFHRGCQIIIHSGLRCDCDAPGHPRDREERDRARATGSAAATSLNDPLTREDAEVAAVPAGVAATLSTRRDAPPAPLPLPIGDDYVWP